VVRREVHGYANGNENGGQQVELREDQIGQKHERREPEKVPREESVEGKAIDQNATVIPTSLMTWFDKREGYTQFAERRTKGCMWR